MNDAQAPWVRIRAGEDAPLGLMDLVRHRELVVFLAWRDVTLRYRQTALGAAWAVLQPVATMVVFTLVFRRLVPVPTGDVPYHLFVLAGLLPWQTFAYGLTHVSHGLVADEALVTRVYFPRMAIPVSKVLASLVDLAFALGAFGVLLAAAGRAPGPELLALPLVVLLTVLATLGVGLLLSALNVRYRDVRHTLPFLTQLWLYVTPVVYPLAVVPGRWRTVFALNPLVAPVEGFRWCLLGVPLPPWSALGPSLLSSLALLLVGLAYFRRAERTFADRI